MREIKGIVEMYNSSESAGIKKALATVVHVRGSSYRRPGARMLVLEDGSITGAISGGCLENDALRKARLAMATDTPRLVVYDTSNEEDASIGVQLGCNGVITVLFEPLADEKDPKITLLENILKTREPSAVVTMFYDGKQDQHPGTCAVLNSDEYFTESFYDLFREKIREIVVRSLREQCSLNHKLPDRDGKQIETFVEFIPPPVSLVIAGAGNDAVPLIRIADTLGWDSQIVDGRHTHLSSGRFPPACQIRLAKPEQVLESIQPDPWTAFVLVTHNYQYDKALLKHLLPLNIPYIGVLGPKKKMERMIQELREEGTEISEEMLRKVYGPVGLEIGAEHPSEIALSVMAEIQAVINGKAGGFLRNKTDVIHS